MCQFLHPKRCRPFCRNGPQHRFGCSRGSSCPKFHPVLCADSLSSKKCYNESCTSTHLKGTKRKRGSQSSQSRHRKPSYPRSNSNVNKRVPPRHSSESRTNISRQPPLPTKPATATTHELTFLVNTFFSQKFLLLNHIACGFGPEY